MKRVTMKTIKIQDSPYYHFEIPPKQPNRLELLQSMQISLKTCGKFVKLSNIQLCEDSAGYKRWVLQPPAAAWNQWKPAAGVPRALRA